jgi:hypothetical protein
LNPRIISCYRVAWRARWLFGIGLITVLLWAGILFARPVSAHGGTVIDSGYTEHFEWLVSIDPYPLKVGEATITLLVFDLTNYDPVSDLQTTLYLAKPGTARPCCDPATLSAAIPLVIDPQLYPGDYSAVITFDQPGDWAMQFVVEGDDRSFTVVVAAQVKEAAPGQAALPGVTPDVAATATVFAQNVQEARQQNSPVEAPVSPIVGSTPSDAPVVANPPSAFTFLGVGWWLWGVAAIIPIVMGWLLLRSPQRQDEADQDEDERQP